MRIITIKVEADHEPTTLIAAIRNLPPLNLYQHTIRIETPKKEGEK